MIRPVKVILTSCVQATCAQMLIVIYRLWKVLTRVEVRREEGWWARK
jgi:hypothetical protein